MMIVMKESATTDQVEAVVRQVEQVGAKAHISKGELHTVIGAIGDRERVANLELEGFPGVDHVVPITRPYKLASLQFRREQYSVLDIGGRKIGGQHFMTIAGPCTIESRDQMLIAAEYVLKEGNENVILCERGIRTFETAYRFTLDLMAIPVLKQHTHLPVIVDPSHAAGRRDLVLPMSLAAAAAGADGIIVEVHPQPERAICDGPQQLRTEEFADYLRQVEAVAQLAGKELQSV